MTNSLIVQKYGGSSLSSPEKIKAVADRIADLKRSGVSVLVVVSAMGKTTDQLIQLALEVSANPNLRELDMLISTGERISMALLSMALIDRKLPAVSFTGSQAGVITTEAHSNARILDIKAQRVLQELEANKTPIIAGFQGVSIEGRNITTLGRGGSDVTAVALAAKLGAKSCEFLKDVDGVFSADPRTVSSARHLARLSIDTLLTLTFWGAKVLHYRSVELAKKTSLHLTIQKSDAHPDKSLKTMIDQEPLSMLEEERFLAVTSHKHAQWLNIEAVTAAEALQKINQLVSETDSAWPQILEFRKLNSQQWTFLITASEINFKSLYSPFARLIGISLDSNQLSIVTATCEGNFASDLVARACAHLQERNIQIAEVLLGPMSISFLVERSQSLMTESALHDLCS